MAQILIVSNRLPVIVKKEHGVLSYSSSIGGLSTGLSSYVVGRKNRWIGWPGIADDELTDDDRHKITVELGRRNCIPVFLTKKQIDEFYSGYSNGLLWPLFHSLPYKDSPDHDRWWRAYRKVNQAFADVILNTAQKSTIVWVHDYLLMLVPGMLRLEMSENHIGFFLHIPFPVAKTFDKLPEHPKLLQGMCGADLVGFHTTGYVKNFLKTCQLADIGLVGDDQIVLLDRAVKVTAFPMGIDYEKFATAGRISEVKRAAEAYKQKYKGLKVIAAVERLDISKGYVERLEAYRKFLRQYPKMQGKVVFVLVGAPSRGEVEAYQKLGRKVNSLAAAINDEFSTAKWQALEYINEAIPFEQVAALFRVTDVAFIAPLHDGMNLVPKEFVASRRSHGVLILSETAGVAQELQDDAIIVSHRDPDSLVRALDQALHMRRREARRRFKRMKKQISTNTVHTWAGSFMKTLQQPIPHSVPHLRTRTLNGDYTKKMVEAYQIAKKRLLLLDYDGTLTGLSYDHTKAAPSPALVNLLKALVADQQNDVVIVSGRDRHDMDTYLGDVPVSLVAEHGAYVKQAGHKTWHNLSKSETEWKKVIKPVLEIYAKKTPGADVEEKAHSLVWHYRQSPPYYAQKYSVIIKRVLKPMLKRYHLELFNGSKILEIRDPQLTKGNALALWPQIDYDFVLAAGDDYTDEDLFSGLDTSCFSIKVGAGRTAARYRAPGYQDLRTLLKRLSR